MRYFLLYYVLKTKKREHNCTMGISLGTHSTTHSTWYEGANVLPWVVWQQLAKDGEGWFPLMISKVWLQMA